MFETGFSWHRRKAFTDLNLSVSLFLFSEIRKKAVRGHDTPKGLLVDTGNATQAEYSADAQLLL